VFVQFRPGEGSNIVRGVRGGLLRLGDTRMFRGGPGAYICINP